VAKNKIQEEKEMNEPMHKCYECGRMLPVSHFNFWNKKKNQYMNICKDCEKKRNTKKHEERKEILNALKTCGCCCCDENDINCLDFHHINPEEKEFNMSAAPNKTIDKILNEASKCVVVCSNCHRKIHAGVIDINDYVNVKQHKYMKNLIYILNKTYGKPKKNSDISV
jgi:ribosomal protein L30E